MSQPNIDPKVSLAILHAIQKGFDGQSAREQVGPGVYRDIVVSMTLEVAEMRVAPDTDKTPTSSIPLLPTLALLLKRMGVQREEALSLLRDVMTEAVTLQKDAAAELLQETGVAEMEARLRDEVISRLPRVPVRGAVTIKPEDVIVTLKGFSVED